MTKWSGLDHRWLAVCVCAAIALILPIVIAPAAPAGPRAVVELFTSQGCSSCPDADRVVGELARDPSVIALSLPVDYWDYLGWKDTLADARFTARQRAYSAQRGDREIYTPQLIVNGQQQVVGSDRAEIDRAIRASAQQSDAMSVPVALSREGNELKVTVPQGQSGVSGEVWVCSIARAVPITIGRGENRGRSVTYHNVVRNWFKLGDWHGQPAHWNVPLENLAGEGVDGAVVFVQNGNRDHPGTMLGAALTTLH